MVNTLNNVILVGRLVKQPELKQTPSGLANCQFTLAVERPYKGQNGEKQTDFINCVAWKKTAEVLAQYCDKGHRIGIEGSIQTRTWDDQNGVKHYVTEVLANQLYFLESKQRGQEQQPSYQKQQNVSPSSFNQPKPQVQQQSTYDFQQSYVDDIPF